MKLPCNMQDNVFNRPLAKSMVENNNNSTKKEKYCLISINGRLDVRKEVQINKLIEINPEIVVL